MAGLENYLSTLKDNAGMAGGYQQGLRDRTAQDTSLATLAQRQAETQRYTGETPSYLQKAGAQARTAELANVQGEADLAAGVPGAKAGQSLSEAKLSAQKAQEGFKQLPRETQIKLIQDTSKESVALLEALETTLVTTGSTQATLKKMLELKPELASDPNWSQALAQYAKLSPTQLRGELAGKRQLLASSANLSDPATQKAYGLEDLQQQGRMELGRQAGQFGVQEAQQRASSAASKPTSDQFLYEQIKAANPGLSEPELAAKFVEAKTLVTKETPSILSPTGTVTTTTRKGGATETQTNDPNLARLPKGSTALGNGVYQLPDGTKVKAN